VTFGSKSVNGSAGLGNGISSPGAVHARRADVAFAAANGQPGESGAQHPDGPVSCGPVVADALDLTVGDAVAPLVPVGRTLPAM
jgi:hypothetical protein